MIVQKNRVLISYNDGSKDPHNRNTAIRLVHDLSKTNIDVVAKGYNEVVDPRTYDWLILIYTPEARRLPVSQTVEEALDLTVKRHMRGVLAITPGPAELPPEWATIRKYDASTPPETIRQAMSYAKTPYTREVMQELARTSSSRLSRWKNKDLFARGALVGSLVAVLLVLALGAYLVTLILPPTTPQASSSSSDPIQDIQSLKNGLRTALANAQASATASTLSSAQTQYNTIIKPQFASTGFRANDMWDNTPPCAFLDPHNTQYQVTSPTPGQYVRCMATATNLKNFAYQVTMNINGDAGGIIFRFDDRTGAFYRFSVRSNVTAPGYDEYGVYQCTSEQRCTTTNGIGDGTQLKTDSVQVDSRVPVTLTVIAKDSTIDLYINGKFIYRLADQQVPSGAIGVYAASINTSTTVIFTNLKVWQLDK